MHRNRGFSLIELLIVIAVLMVMLAVGLPKARQMMMASREIATIREIEVIQTAQAQYYSTYSRYAENLEQLGPPRAGKEGAEAAGLLPEDLASGKKGGYLFSLVGVPEAYGIWAIPEAWNKSGRRTFYADQTLVIRHNWSAELATAGSPEVHDAATANAPGLR